MLDEDSRRRLHSNPLRILDSKNPAMQEVVEGGAAADRTSSAPTRSRTSVRVRHVLDAAGLGYRVNPRLVRGLDYYNLTVFEWVTERLGSQGTVCGGGRYDGLFEQLGGKPTPAVGWGMGIERMLLLIEAVGIPMPTSTVDVYAIVPDADALPVAMTTCEELRALGLSVLTHAAASEGLGSMKSQFRRANASGARLALIFGADELARGAVGLKDLKNEGTPQTTPALKPIAELAVLLKSVATRPT